MKTTPQMTGRRVALLPVKEARHDRPAIRRYKLARVIDDLGATLAGYPDELAGAAQTPARGVRAP